MRNFIEDTLQTPETELGVQEAEATLQSLVNQLEAADDLESELAASSKDLAFRAFTAGGAAKSQLERLEKDISSIQAKQKMLGVAIS